MSTLLPVAMFTNRRPHGMVALEVCHVREGRMAGHGECPVSVLVCRPYDF